MWRVCYVDPLNGKRSVQHRPDGTQHINGSNNQSSPAGKDCNQAKWLPSSKKNGDFTGKVGESGKATGRKCTHNKRRSNEWQFAQQTAKPRNFQCASLLIDITTQSENQRRQEAMGDHYQDRASDSDDAQGCNTEKNKTHVSNTRIPRQPAEIFLAHGHPAAIDEITQAKPGDDGHPDFGSIGEHRQRNANETVQAKFFQHTCMEHCRWTWRGTIAEWSPGVKGPERDQNAKAEKQHREDEPLGGGLERMLLELGDELGNIESLCP